MLLAISELDGGAKCASEADMQFTWISTKIVDRVLQSS